MSRRTQLCLRRPLPFWLGPSALLLALAACGDSPGGGPSDDAAEVSRDFGAGDLAVDPLPVDAAPEVAAELGTDAEDAARIDVSDTGDGDLEDAEERDVADADDDAPDSTGDAAGDATGDATGDGGMLGDADASSLPDVPAPAFPDPIEVLHITTLTGSAAGDDSDGGPVSLCLSATDCFTLNNADWDDRELGSHDVFVFEGVGLPRSRFDRVELRVGGESWVPACVEVRFDGDPVYCNDAIGRTFGDDFTTQWTDTELSSSCVTCFDSTITHGPMVGAVTPHSARLWLRADAQRRATVRVATSAAGLDAAPTRALTYSLASADFTAELLVEGLRPDTDYHYRVEVGDDRVDGTFSTAPAPAPRRTTFAFGSCSRYDEQPIFATIEAAEPDFFLFIGDNHYGNTGDLASLRQFYRWALERPERAALLDHTPTVATWDDHDFVGNNTDGTAPGKDVALRVFDEYWANTGVGIDGVPGVFSRWSYGDIELFLVDDRYWRGLEGSILGDAQSAWLLSALRDSDAVFKFVASGSQWTTEGTGDSWAAFPEAQQAFLQTIADEGIEGVVLLSGDVHRSELRMLPGGIGGYSVPELVSSPLANSSSGCSESAEVVSCRNSDNYFVFVEVDTTLADPEVRATIRDSGGAVLDELVVAASALRNPARVPQPPRAPDFDGDGYADLAIGAPYEEVSGASATGMVHVMYGSSIGPRSLGSVAIHQDTTGIPGSNEAGDLFGRTLAAGDFDGDSFADLAVGVPHEAIGDIERAGAVVVIPGSAAGLVTSRAVSFHQGRDDVTGSAEAGDELGAALVAGDFNGDEYDDLAVGVPGQNQNAGQVQVFYGSAEGLSAVGMSTFDQDNTGSSNTAERDDRFGAALASGDFNGDGGGDLAVGAPGEAIGALGEAGAVSVFYSFEGAWIDLDQSFGEGATGRVPAEIRNAFGAALAAGDLDGDGVDEVIVGAPEGGAADGGAVWVFWGEEDRLVDPTDHTYHAAADDGWRLGQGVAYVRGAGGGGAVLVGAPSANDGAGAVFTVEGSVLRPLSLEPFQLAADPAASWGATVSSADFDGDGVGDAVIGGPGATVSGEPGAGAVLVAPSSCRVCWQRWEQDLRNIDGTAEAADGFGEALVR